MQLRAELEREELLQSAQLPIQIPVDHSLAMKADLALPWAKLRVINKYSEWKLDTENIPTFDIDG